MLSHMARLGRTGVNLARSVFILNNSCKAKQTLKVGEQFDERFLFVMIRCDYFFSVNNICKTKLVEQS